MAIQQEAYYKNLQSPNTVLEQEVRESTRELAASQHRFRAIFDNTFQFMGLLTTEGILLEANQTALNFGGLKLEDVVNRPFWETHWWKISQINRDRLKQVIAHATQGEFIRYEVDILGADSNIITIDFSLFPLKDKSGQVIELIAEGRDISDKKHLERERQETIEVLKASERELWEIFNSIVDVILVIDKEGRYLKIAPTSPEKLYLSAEELLGKTVHEVLPSHLADQFVSIIGQTLATQQPSECEYSLQIDNQKVWFSAKVSPISPETVIWVARDISTIKRNEIIHQQANQALEENQILLQLVMDSLPQAIFWKDRNSRFLGCNRQMVLDAGLSSSAEIIGKTDFDMPWKEEAPRYQADDRIVIESGQPKFNIEEPLIKSDNRRVWLRTNKIPLSNPTGEIVGVLGSYEDITERKEIGQALEASRRRYATLTASAPVGIYRIDAEGNYSYVNDRWCQIVGLTAKKVIGNQWNKWFSPADEERIQAEWCRCTQTNETFTLEYQFQRPDGGKTWVLGQVVQEIDQAGEIIGYVGTITDINRRKEAESALRDSEEKFRQFAENSRSVMLLHQVSSGELLYVNPAYEQIWGQSCHSLYENPDSWMSFLHPDDLRCLNTANRANNQQEFVNEEYRIIRPDGSMQWIWGRRFPIRDTAGNIYRLGTIGEDITKRKQIEQERDRLLQVLAAQNQTLETQVRQRTAELQKSKERFRNLVETSSDWVWEVDESGVYTYASPQVINVLGYSPEEILGQTPFDLMPPEEAQRVLKEFMKFASNQAPFQCLENTNQHKDGRLIILETSAVPIFDADQHFCGYRGMDRDITARKQAERVIRQNEAQFQRITANIPGIMYQYIRHSHGADEFVCVSDRCRELFELEPSTIQQDVNVIFNLIHPDDIVSFQESITHSAHSLEQWTWEGRMITPSGRLKWIQGISQPEQHANGDILWDGLILDISEKQAALRERELVEAEILRSRDLHEAIFNESTDALFLVNIETLRTMDCNQRAVEMFAATHKTELIDIEGHQLQQQQFTPTEIQAISDDIDRQGFWSREIEYNTLTGQPFWGSLAAKQITVAGQKMNLVRVTDISQHKLADTQIQETNKQLAASNEELARATRLKDEFLANMSHELRTPLNAILGISEGLQNQVFGAINERQHRGLQTIERSGTHLLALINDILDLSKIEAGQMELDYTQIGINQLCQSSLSFIKQQAFQKRIQLQVKLQPNLPKLLVDERRIRQVLINLLNNAVKFTPEGGSVTLAVTQEQYSPETETTHLRSFIRMAVIDTGIGIAPENLHKLFQPFVQIDSSLNRQYTGTGLGLSLVKRIVEMHGGKVGISSQISVGSRFIVDLPCVNISTFYPKCANQSQLSLAPISKETPPESRLILLAEDNEATILTVSSYLEAKGYRMILAKNGQEAIEFTQSHLPELILMDIQMPRMDGLEAIRQIRLNPDLATLPIIAMTALAMPGDQEKCLAAGANYYLTKPLKLKHLANTIQQLLK